MALNVIVKNTFLDLDESTPHQAASRKRSSSVPRACKLSRASSASSLDAESGPGRRSAPPSAASTCASDSDSSDTESGQSPLFGREGSSGSLKDLFMASAPVADDKRELYMLWMGDISGLVLPAAVSQGEPMVITWSWNATATEFKMPMLPDLHAPAPHSAPSPIASPTSSQTPSPHLGTTAADTGGVSATPSLLSSSGGGSRLNPQAHAFQPGVAFSVVTPQQTG
mmetsp:Transcript_51878/g.168645  ORF Transcript_51878/g.168645 Transcript_51878/m.168645 type:complete len:226 (-) Transcript_51878:152-829(-)